MPRIPTHPAAQGSSELKWRFRKAREQASLTLRDLAAKSGQPLSTITDIEGGRRMPRIDTLEKLAHTLRVSAGWLAYGDGTRPEWLQDADSQSQHSGMPAESKT